MKALPVVTLLVTLAGGGASATAQAPALANTSWQLKELQSMDDAQGTKRPAVGTQYTMRLGADGRASLKLNCNSATGTWSAKAGAEGTSGEFTFGPMAVTSALCPPPSLDEQIARQAQYVRSYLLKDGRLHLSLMADGGIQVWEPEKQGDPGLEAAIRNAAGDVSQARYVAGRADLNGDGKEEVFVYLMGPMVCGTGGCNLMLFRGGSQGYTLVQKFPITQTPVIVSPNKTKRWNDLWRAEAGGGAAASFVRHGFNGRKYVERQRVPGNKTPEGKVVIPTEVKFQDGIPLGPGR
jgi:heat shock protein HslJ